MQFRVLSSSSQLLRFQGWPSRGCQGSDRRASGLLGWGWDREEWLGKGAEGGCSAGWCLGHVQASAGAELWYMVCAGGGVVSRVAEGDATLQWLLAGSEGC